MGLTLEQRKEIELKKLNHLIARNRSVLPVNSITIHNY